MILSWGGRIPKARFRLDEFVATRLVSRRSASLRWVEFDDVSHPCSSAIVEYGRQRPCDVERTPCATTIALSSSPSEGPSVQHDCVRLGIDWAFRVSTRAISGDLVSRSPLFSRCGWDSNPHITDLQSVGRARMRGQMRIPTTSPCSQPRSTWRALQYSECA